MNSSWKSKSVRKGSRYQRTFIKSISVQQVSTSANIKVTSMFLVSRNLKQWNAQKEKRERDRARVKETETEKERDSKERL